MQAVLSDTEITAYSEAEAFPTIGVILLGGVSDKMKRIPMHVSAGFAYTGVQERIGVRTRVYVHHGKPSGSLNGERVGYSETGRSPFVILNHYRERIMENLGLDKGSGLSISFESQNFGVLSGSSDAGAAAMGKCVEDLAGGIDDPVGFENELRAISESVGRSLHGGLTVTWADGRESRTERLLGPEAFRDFHVIGCRFNVQRKPSDRIHENIVGSPDYSRRIESTAAKGKKMVSLAEEGDIRGIFDLAHDDTNEYHSLIESVGVKVITPEMRSLMDKVDEIRKRDWLSYIVTGGSNVFVIAEKNRASEYVEMFRERCDGISLLSVADGATIISRAHA